MRLHHEAVASRSVQPWTVYIEDVITNCDILATILTSLAHELHYVVSANYYVAVVRETAGAEDRVQGNLLNKFDLVT